MDKTCTEIAVVGLGCILPDATTPDAFWANLLAGHSSLRRLSRTRYDWNSYVRAVEPSNHLFEEPIGAEIGALPFDWRKFKISPLDAQAINPMHLHVLEAGAQALEQLKDIPHSTAGIFIGGTGLGWQRDSGMRIRLPEFLEAANQAAMAAGIPADECREIILRTRQEFEKRLRPVSDDGVVNALSSIAGGRLAMRFDLRGPHAGIDAGFASGLAAVAEAIQLLRDGTIDLALAGGASESISPLDLLAFHRMAVLAPNQVRPFDAEAEGTLLGEGVALFALKRLTDAVAQNERIYAVIRGIGASSDGRSRSLLAPSVDGQALAMERAYLDAELPPSSIGYVECHATGTALGDASELKALRRVFRGVEGPAIAIGSAKPFVGHLRGGSGAVGLLRAVLALYHRTIPAQIGFKKPHPALQLDGSPFFVPVESQALTVRGSAAAPRASVSSFGLGGINFHAVLEAWTPQSSPADFRPEQATQPRQSNQPLEPIAIVGLGGLLPGADSVPEFWRALEEERDATREVPVSRFPMARYYDPDPARLDKSYTRIGCFIEPAPDPGKDLPVPPAARAQIDPGQILTLRAAQQAVADSGLETLAWDRARTAVILGFLGCQGRRMLAEARMNFHEFATELATTLHARGVSEGRIRDVLAGAEQLALNGLPPVTEDTLPGYLGSINAARVARKFDLKGPHFVVDSACASSLAALHAAVRLLRSGTVDTVLLGGVWADGQPEFFVQNCRFSALSANAITPFDERASGFVPGEGAVVLVLRRLRDAERDGQKIHAVVRAIEASSDGGAGRSIYSPCVAGEALAMRRALEAAALSPDQVDYVECHGTGTALGDVTEVQACTQAYGEGRERPLFVGSVKSNVGHLMAGAGAAALLKTTLALREGVIPASLKVKKLNPKIDFARGPVQVVTSKQQWDPPNGRQRRAGVSAFGLGGTNFHAILEEYRPALGQLVTPGNERRRPMPWARALPIATASGPDLACCGRVLKELANELRNDGDERYLSRLALSQEQAAPPNQWRVAIVARDGGVLFQRSQLLAAALDAGRDLAFLRSQGVFVAKADRATSIAAVFPGQGPQYPNMLRDASAAFPELALSLERIDRSYEALCGRKLSPSFFTDHADTYLQNDEDIHCAVFAVNVALFELLRSHGVQFDAVMGQSAGELSALVAAGSLSLEDGLHAIRERTLSVLGIRSSDPGRMVTLSCGAEQAARLMAQLPGYAALAADNGPSACIVSGDRPATQELLKRAAESGVQATILPVSHGYHSQLIAAARPPYRKALDSMRFAQPKLELFSTITGTSIRGVPTASYPAHLESQFVEPVRLRQAVTALHDRGIRLFVECGPKWPLTTFINEILADRPHTAQATIHPKLGEVEQLNRAFACLYVHGACELSTVRKSNTSMTASPRSLDNATSSHEPVASAGTLEPERLVDVLRSIRDLIDHALEPAQKPDSTTQADAEAPSAVCAMIAEEPKSSPEISHPLSSEVVTLETPVNPEPQGAGAPDTDRFDAVRAKLCAELVNRTGYPEDMLDLDLDLEAELGIDTVKQVAALAAVREHYGLKADPKFRMQDARTLRQAVAYLVERIAGTCTSIRRSTIPPLQADSPSGTFHTVERSSAGAQSGVIPALRSRQPSSAPDERPPEAIPVAPATASKAAGATDDSIPEQVRSLLVSELIARTHYPQEMLEPDLDLEAELGIDTVKQVAALAAVREKFGLPPDPRFKMQDARTLRQAVEYLSGRLRARAAPGPLDVSENASPSHPSAPVASGPRQRNESVSAQPAVTAADSSPKQPFSGRHVSLSSLATALHEIQEYVNSLALLIGQELRRTDADGQAESKEPTRSKAMPRRSIYPEVLLDSILPQAGCPSTEEIVEVRGLTVTAPDAPLPEETNEELGDSTLRARADDGQIVALSRHVRASAVSPSASPSILNAVREGRAVSDPSQLRDYLAKSGRTGTSTLQWVHSNGFSMSVGGARVPSDCTSPSRVMSELLGSAFDVTSYAWFGFTGALHALAAVDRVRFYRVPDPNDEILLCARSVHPEGGFWRADVVAFDGSGRIFAELSGVQGMPWSSPGAPAETRGSDPADRAWRRFAQRLGRELDLPEDLAS